MLDQLPPFVVNVLRLSVWLTILGAVFVPLERLFAVRPSKIFRKEVAIDTFYYFANSLLPGLLLAPPNSYQAVSYSANHGLPILKHAPRDPVSRALREFAKTLVPDEVPVRAGWLGGLRRQQT